MRLPRHKNMIITVKDEDKPEVVAIAKRFSALGYKIFATRSTAKVLKEHGVKAVSYTHLDVYKRQLYD